MTKIGWWTRCCVHQSKIRKACRVWILKAGFVLETVPSLSYGLGFASEYWLGFCDDTSHCNYLCTCFNEDLYFALPKILFLFDIPCACLCFHSLSRERKRVMTPSIIWNTEFVTLFKHVKSLPYFCSAIFAAKWTSATPKGQGWRRYLATLNHELWCMDAINGVSQRIKLSMYLHRSNMVRLAPKRLHFLENWSGYDSGWYQGGGLGMKGTNMVMAIVSIYKMVWL